MASIFDDPNDIDGQMVPLVGHDDVSLDEYQAAATELAFYSTTLIYPTLGLAGEAGEVAEKVKKLLRDHDLDLTADNVAEQVDYMAVREIVLEIGDVLWYCANLLNDLNYSMEEAAMMNLDKLRDRRDRHVMTGSGDHR